MLMMRWISWDGALVNLGKYDAAIEYYDKILKINRDDLDVSYNKGLAIGSQGNQDSAIHLFDKILLIQIRI